MSSHQKQHNKLLGFKRSLSLVSSSMMLVGRKRQEIHSCCLDSWEADYTLPDWGGDFKLTPECLLLVSSKAFWRAYAAYARLFCRCFYVSQLEPFIGAELLQCQEYLFLREAYVLRFRNPVTILVHFLPDVLLHNKYEVVRGASGDRGPLLVLDIS
jgi:hypothetical protein